ncbi:MAG: aspartate aminotransferase family protein [Desulfobacteraceae bacterium]|nr:aspartate aminotransferase family protein [Desulfobacteraceae bacterium]
MENSSIQNKMFEEVNSKLVFDKSHEYAYEYLTNAFERNIYPTDEALSDLKHFDENLPQTSSDAIKTLTKLHQYGSPATVSQIGGRYFGFVNGSVVPAGLAARLLSDFWDQNAGMEVISPISSHLEIIVEKWLRQLFNLPDNTVAGFVSGTSSATFCGLAAARYKVLQKKGWDVNQKGLFGAPKIRIVTGNQAHSTVLKAIGLLGFGKNNIEWVDTDEQGRIIPESIPELDENTILILQAGNVNSGSFDALEEICTKANNADAWVHIDGAFGLWAGAVTKLKHLTKGMEKANSWSVDAHKTLNTPYDCGIVLCKDEEALVSALHMTGSYIVLGDKRDGMFYTPEMSRRARIIELWATMKYLGRDGIDEMVYGLHKRAVQFAEELKSHDFEILNDVVFNQVLVHCETDELTKKILGKIQEMRVCWCGGSQFNNKDVIRISVCSWATTSKDISVSVESFIKARESVKKHC